MICNYADTVAKIGFDRSLPRAPGAADVACYSKAWRSRHDSRDRLGSAVTRRIRKVGSATGRRGPTGALPASAFGTSERPIPLGLCPKSQGHPEMRIAQVAPLYESCPPQLYGGTERVVS